MEMIIGTGGNLIDGFIYMQAYEARVVKGEFLIYRVYFATYVDLKAAWPSCQLTGAQGGLRDSRWIGHGQVMVMARALPCLLAVAAAAALPLPFALASKAE